MSRHRMGRKTRFFLVALIVVGVAGGAIHYRFGGGVQAHADRFVSRIDGELHLDRDQLAALHALKSTLLSLHRDWHRAAGADAERMTALLVAPSLDQQALLDLVAEHTRTVNEKAPEVVAALARFTDSLDAGQKATMRDTIGQKRRWHHRPGHGS